MTSLVAKGKTATAMAEARSAEWTVFASFCCKDEMVEA
jgi:hypothetical protein